MNTPDLLCWVKRSDIEIVQISTFWLNLSELIVFGYDLSDKLITKMSLGIEEMGFIFRG